MNEITDSVVETIAETYECLAVLAEVNEDFVSVRPVALTLTDWVQEVAERLSEELGVLVVVVG